MEQSFWVKSFSMRDEAIELIVGSAQQAVTRLQFFRQTYGRVNYQGEADMNECRALAIDFFDQSRIVLDWPEHSAAAVEVSVSRKMAKLALNALVLASNALPRGGTITVEVLKQDNDQSKVIVCGRGVAIKMEEETEDALQLKTQIEALTPKTVQPYYMAFLADSIDVGVAAEADDESITITLSHK